MSIYGHLLCIDCSIGHWIKDADTPIDGNLEQSGRFLEDHKNHKLEYIHDDDQRLYEPDYKDFEGGVEFKVIEDFHIKEAAKEMYSEIENDISNLNDDIDKLKRSIIGALGSEDGFAQIEYDIEQAEYFRDRKVKLLAKARGE